MAKTQVEVITSVERRRRWSSAEKEQLVTASLEPGAVVSALAREAGLHPSQLTNGGASCVGGNGQHRDSCRLDDARKNQRACGFLRP